MMAEDQGMTTAAETPDRLLQQAVAHHKADRLEEARALYKRILEIDPEHARALQYLGVIARRNGQPKHAVALLERSLEKDPADPGCYINLSRACLDKGDPHRAEQCLRAGLERWPDNWELWNRLSMALNRRKDFEGALAAAQRAAKIQPDNVESQMSLGSAHYRAGNHEAALTSFDAVITRAPNHAQAHHNRATLLKLLGRHAEAIDAYRLALQVDPTNTEAWRSFVGIRKFSADDPDLAALERVFESGRLDDQRRMSALFALGKIYEDIGQNNRAFWCYREGNRIKRESITFDINQAIDRMTKTRRVFSHRLVSDKRGLGYPDPTPIFILGMPRSGTTLVEQILASHPEVAGAGELYDFSKMVAEGVPNRGYRGGFPDWVPELKSEEFESLGKEYIDSIRRSYPHARFVTDKMPANFLYIGLIRLILPQAKIIHTRRHPADTCVSCFTKLFVEGQKFSFDLGELGRYYRAYEELMAHWRSVLDAGEILDVSYERVVDDTQTQTRRLLEFCGLPWDDSCLRFHETQRMVATASTSQVRQPVYDSSVQRWRKFSNHLGPLFTAFAVGFRDSGPS